MAKRIRIGLVGCGRRGSYIASLFQKHPLAQVTALMDPFPACTAESAKKLGLADAKIYHDFDRFLADSPTDALLIASDPLKQVDLACRAMETGRHACTEVPAAFTIDECWRLIRTVNKTRCKYQLMEQTRYWGFVDEWRGMVERGELGHVCLAQGEYVHYERDWNYWVDPKTGQFHRQVTKPANSDFEATWRQKVFGDPILYLPHTLSPMLKMLGTRVRRVSCMGTRPGSYSYPDEPNKLRDIEYALMHTENDNILMVGAGFSMPHVKRGPLHSHWYELRGTKGSVTSPRYPGDHSRQWKIGGETYEPCEFSTTPVDATEEESKSGHGGADFKPVDTFLHAIANDTTPPVDAVLTAEITAPAILAAESARRGGALLELPDFRAV